MGLGLEGQDRPFTSPNLIQKNQNLAVLHSCVSTAGGLAGEHDPGVVEPTTKESPRRGTWQRFWCLELSEYLPEQKPLSQLSRTILGTRGIAWV